MSDKESKIDKICKSFMDNSPAILPILFIVVIVVLMMIEVIK